MLSLSQKQIVHFGVSAFSVASALIITFQIDVLDGRTLLLFAAVVFAAWLGGRSAGFFALVLATLAAAYFVLPNQFSFQLTEESIIRLVIFLVLGIPITWLIGSGVESERLLKASEARYRLLFDNNPFPMWVFDIESLEFLAVNVAATNSYGYTKEEFLAMTTRKMRPSEDLPAFLLHIQSELPQVENALPWRHVKKDGTIIDVETSSHAITLEGRRARLVLINDVTDRLLAEAEIRNNESRLKTIVENLTEGLVVADLSGDIVSFNRAALNMHGFALREECQISLEQFSERFPLSDLNGNLLDLEDYPLSRILRGEHLRDLELHIERSDRPFNRTFSYGGTIIYDANNEPLIAVVMIADITERKKAEEQNRRLNETLESRVALRTAELQAVNKELESFSYSVSHDLRAPLRHIDGFSRSLLEDYGNVLDDHGKEFIQEVQGASREMGHLIDDVLKLAQVSKSELSRKKIDLSKIASEIVSKRKMAEPSRQIDVTIESGLSAFGDARLMRVALTNLFENAWKFTSNRQNAEIVFCRKVVNGNPSFCLRDNGSGFNMKYSDRLFRAFQRLHSSDEFEGTGIGLATVQRVINRHGGQIWAESEVGVGSEFYFSLPEASTTEVEIH